LIKQLVSIIGTAILLILIAAIKAPMLFKKNVEYSIEQKADKSELEKKVDKTEFEQYKITAEKIEDLKFKEVASEMQHINQNMKLLLKHFGIAENKKSSK